MSRLCSGKVIHKFDRRALFGARQLLKAISRALSTRDRGRVRICLRPSQTCFPRWSFLLSATGPLLTRACLPPKEAGSANATSSKSLRLTQSGRAIWNLENADRWKDWHSKIQHSDFTDPFGFKSYRIAAEHIPHEIPQPKDPSHFRCQFCPHTAVALAGEHPRCGQHHEVLKAVHSLS